MEVFVFITKFTVVLAFLSLGSAQLMYSLTDTYKTNRWLRPMVGMIGGGLLLIVGLNSLFKYFFYG